MTLRDDKIASARGEVIDILKHKRAREHEHALERARKHSERERRRAGWVNAFSVRIGIHRPRGIRAWLIMLPWYFLPVGVALAWMWLCNRLFGDGRYSFASGPCTVCGDPRDTCRHTVSSQDDPGAA